MLKVGLTGGIGSGKTTVGRIFQLLGVPLFIADLEAKEILASDPDVRTAVQALLGPQAYVEGSPDRAWIASRVFDSPELLKGLNAIIHPAVRGRFDSWTASYSTQPYVIQEAAILIESGGAALMDRNILVWAPEEIRITRVAARDGTPTEAVKKRMEHQMPDDAKVTSADFVIINDGAHPLIRQILEIHRALRFPAENLSG